MPDDFICAYHGYTLLLQGCSALFELMITESLLVLLSVQMLF